MTVTNSWEVVARRTMVDRIMETRHDEELFFTVKKVILHLLHLYFA